MADTTGRALRLRSKVSVVHDATVTLERPAERGDALRTLARARRETERVTFAYAAAAGEQSQRRIEPHRLIATSAAGISSTSTSTTTTGARSGSTGSPRRARRGGGSRPGKHRTRPRS